MEPEELRKEVVRTVKDVVRSGLNRYLLHRLGVMNGRCRDMEKRRNLGFNIVESMDFYTPFFLRNFAQQKTARQSSTVVESKA